MTSLPLTFLARPAQPAAGQEAWLLVLMHGVGSNEQDLFGLAPHVPPQFHVPVSYTHLTLPTKRIV